MSSVVNQVAAANPAALRNSCQESGGTWEFMDAVIDTLRANYDTRWGYNCKRGNCGDPSLDVITYHYSAGNDEGNSEVYIIDIIGGALRRVAVAGVERRDRGDRREPDLRRLHQPRPLRPGPARERWRRWRHRARRCPRSCRMPRAR